jgi:mono/diheme cytochrome c family protein
MRETGVGRQIAVFVAAAAAALVSALPAPASAQLANAERGRELSQRLCTNCHVIDASPSGPVRVDVPSFVSIAARPDVSPALIAGGIIMPHPAMPGVQLTVPEIRDIVAYILSLKPQK